MLSINRLVLFVFALFLSTVLADLHDNCACNNDGAYNWRITTKACDVYNGKKFDNGAVSYNSTTGRCVQDSTTDKLQGDQWQEACQEVAKTGFDCTDGKGTCFATPNEVSGDC